VLDARKLFCCDFHDQLLRRFAPYLHYLVLTRPGW
jgi:hypothetical protein